MNWNLTPFQPMSTYMTYETGVLDYVDFPQTEDPLWLLGRKYSTIYDLEDLRHSIKSLLWLTYRKNFPAIGGTGPTSDQGWGCMLRCGQMVLAQSLISRHLGKDWRWNPEHLEPDYVRILRMFQDKKTSPFSIHQIALMGNSEGKSVSQWFGPNTIAHVLKKLVVYDEWTGSIIHVAMDNTVIMDDIKKICCKKIPEKSNLDVRNRKGDEKYTEKYRWQPLLLFIPLRLGLTDINPIYNRGLKTCFVLSSSLGIIGGRPNHALYFVGVVGNEVIFLDPHTTQCAVDLDKEEMDDSSYHSPVSGRMDISQLDPSIALCFYFDTEAEFNNWCTQVQSHLILPEKQPLFELCKERPPHWPSYEPEVKSGPSFDFTLVERQFDPSDEEFELL